MYYVLRYKNNVVLQGPKQDFGPKRDAHAYVVISAAHRTTLYTAMYCVIYCVMYCVLSVHFRGIFPGREMSRSGFVPVGKYPVGIYPVGKYRNREMSIGKYPVGKCRSGNVCHPTCDMYIRQPWTACSERRRQRRRPRHSYNSKYTSPRGFML